MTLDELRSALPYTELALSDRHGQNLPDERLLPKQIRANLKVEPRFMYWLCAMSRELMRLRIVVG